MEKMIFTFFRPKMSVLMGARGWLERDVDGFLAFVDVAGGVPFAPFADGPVVFHVGLEAGFAVVVPGLPLAVEQEVVEAVFGEVAFDDFAAVFEIVKAVPVVPDGIDFDQDSF